MKLWTLASITLLPGLVACVSQPERPAPVESGARQTIEGDGVQTFGYGESGPADSSQRLTPVPNEAMGEMPGQSRPRSLEPAPITQNTPAGQASSGTVESLLQVADGQEHSGNLNGAAATLERSLRIQPQNAVLWHRLANIRFKQGQYARATSLATKSNSLAGGNASLSRNNWLLIAKAKGAEGDHQGAQEAQQKAAGSY